MAGSRKVLIVNIDIVWFYHHNYPLKHYYRIIVFLRWHSLFVYDVAVEKLILGAGGEPVLILTLSTPTS